MIRKFLSLDGEVLEESEWELKPTDKCFYCQVPLVTIFSAFDEICWESQGGTHDWITVVKPTEVRG